MLNEPVLKSNLLPSLLFFFSSKTFISLPLRTKYTVFMKPSDMRREGSVYVKCSSPSCLSTEEGGRMEGVTLLYNGAEEKKV